MSLQKVKDIWDAHLIFHMMQILSTVDESYNVMTKTDHPYPKIFPKNPSKCFFLQVHWKFHWSYGIISLSIHLTLFWF
jgi:hypothetical protein